jgi:phosphonoacetaldehyde hydrolase
MLDHLYAAFLDFQVEAARERCVLIEGVAEVVKQLEARGMKIGMTTGYPAEIVDAIRPQLERSGLPTEVIVTASDVAVGRPAPWMICRAAEALGVYPLDQVVVVDDTQAGVQAGINAGCRTIGVSRTGNLLGLSEMELRSIGDRRESILADACNRLKEAGADHVLESVADLNEVIEPAA